MEKKEIIDHLRNKQKAAEIEAKVNGINLWVLLGAISVVTWQLIGSVGGGFLDRPDLIVRTLFCAEALYLFSWLGRNARRAREELRYSQWSPDQMESPFLVLLLGTLLLLPPTLSLAIEGKNWNAAILGFFGLILVGISLAAISSRVLNFSPNTEKFPKPDFGLTTRGEALGDLFFGTAFTLVILGQGTFAWEHRGIFTVDLAKQLTLLSALYLLLVVTVQRKLHSNRIEWTYELETELLLGTVTPEVAARRIEHRGLGPRLQDVMDRLFDDMDRRVSELDSLFDQSRSKLELVKEVPLEYGAERAARIQNATQCLSAHIDALATDCDDFGSYMKKLEEKNTGTRKPILAPHLANLKARHEKYAERLRNSKAELKRLVPKGTAWS